MPNFGNLVPSVHCKNRTVPSRGLPNYVARTYVHKRPLCIDTLCSIDHMEHSTSLPLSLDDMTLSVRTVIQSLLRRCDMPYPPPTVDPEFVELCFQAAIERGYPLTGKGSLRPFIVGCSAMSITAYAHIQDERIRVFITLYTAALVYMDDFYEHDVEVVRNFNQRFMQNQPHGDGVQDAFTKMLLTELPTLYNPFVANLITTSTLNYVNGLLLEHDTRGMKISTEAVNYPTFSRLMSGSSEAYALFVFPPELPLQSYIQALPDIRVILNQGNDVFSFYKEELVGDSVNYVSLIAAIRGTTKIQALASLSNDVVDAHKRCLQILSKDAHEAYLRFSHGYVGFHVSLDRYRLDELKL